MSERYLIFAGEHYYPRRGFLDFVEEVDSFMDAKKMAMELLGKDDNEWAQIVNKRTNQIEAEFDIWDDVSDPNAKLSDAERSE